MADEEQHPWIFGLGPERETLIRELNTTDDTPPVPGLEAQNSILGDFTQDSIELIQWYTDCLPQMGNLSQSLNVANNGIILFLQLPGSPTSQPPLTHALFVRTTTSAAVYQLRYGMHFHKVPQCCPRRTLRTNMPFTTHSSAMLSGLQKQ